MSIRKVQKNEAGELAALHGRAFDRGWSALELAGLVAQPHTVALCDVHEDRIAAFILVRCLAGEAEILTLATDPLHRREGRAGQLVKCALRQCREAGAQMLYLEVSVANDAAIKLYEGLGFSASGVRPRYYADGSDAVLMQMALDQ